MWRAEVGVRSNLLMGGSRFSVGIGHRQSSCVQKQTKVNRFVGLSDETEELMEDVATGGRARFVGVRH